MGTTRYYFTGAPGTHPAPVSPAFGSSWTDLEDAQRNALRTAYPTVTAGFNADEAVNTAQNVLALQSVGPPLAAGQLSGTARAVAILGTTFGSTDLAFFRLVIRVVSGDGATQRGVLATLQGATSIPNVPGKASRTVSGALTPVTAEAGDRLVVEVGARYTNTNAFASSLAGSPGQPGTVVDLAFTEGQTNSNLWPWVELILDEAPQVPTDLAVDAGMTTAAVSWSPPATGQAPTGYTVQVTGSDPVDVGLVTSHELTDLTPGTDYTVVVRAYNAVGPGPAASADFTTDPAITGYYRAEVVLGDHTWSAELGDPPSLGPILPLSLGWVLPDDAPGLPAQPDPDTATVLLVTESATDLAGVGIDTPALVRVWNDPDPDARPYAIVEGRVADMEAGPRTLPGGGHGIAWSVLVVGYETDLSMVDTGATEWPAESGDARAGRIFAQAGLTGWAPSSPVANDFAIRPARTAKVAELLTETLSEAARYLGDETTPAARHLWSANTDGEGHLDATEPWTADLVARQSDFIDELDGAWVNRATSWRRTRRTDAEWVQITHPGGVDFYGDRRGPARPAITVSVTDPDPYAELVLDTAAPAVSWQTGEWFRVELHAGAPAHYGLDWFRRDPTSGPYPWTNRVVVIRNIQVMPGMFTDYAGMLTAARVVIQPGGRLVVEFRLRPDVPAWSSVATRWLDEPAGATWADELAEDPTGTWWELRYTPQP